jgi:hypothetical protein
VSVCPATIEEVCNFRNLRGGVWNTCQSHLLWSYPSFDTAKWNSHFLVICWYYCESIRWLKTNSERGMNWSIVNPEHNFAGRRSWASILTHPDPWGVRNLIHSLILSPSYIIRGSSIEQFGSGKAARHQLFMRYSRCRPQRDTGGRSIGLEINDT